MSRDRAIETITAYFDEGTFQSDLSNLVSYETESQNPDQAPELKRYLQETMEPRLTAMGFTCSLHDNPAPRPTSGARGCIPSSWSRRARSSTAAAPPTTRASTPSSWPPWPRC